MSGPTIKFNPFTHKLDYVGSSGGPPPPVVYYSLTPYIVGPDVHSQYSTISLAIAAAVGAGVSSSNPANIHIKPKSGGYTEDPVLVDGINLVGQSPQTVINGKVSMTTAGTATINGLTMQDNGDYSLQIGGSAGSSILVDNCNFNVISNTAINIGSTANGIITLKSCNMDGQVMGAAIFAVDSGTLRILNCILTGQAASTTSGSVQIVNSGMAGPITTSGGAAASLGIINSTASGLISVNGTGGNNYISNTYLPNYNINTVVLTIGAGSQCYVTNCTISSIGTNVITGAGTLFYALISFFQSSGVSVSTATPLATLI